MAKLRKIVKQAKRKKELTCQFNMCLGKTHRMFGIVALVE